MPKKNAIMTETETATKTDAEKYDKIKPRDHILLRPDTYIGDIEPTQEDMWVYMNSNNIIKKKNISYTPGFLKVIDELLVNARDASINDPSCDTIKVEFNKEENYISIHNNGDIGIPVEEHPVHKMLAPTMIFGELLTSSNYNDDEKRTTGGRNGLGSKCISASTMVPLYDGSMKQAKDITLDDKLIGDDGMIRNILKIIKDNGQMYDVIQSHGETYCVNDMHILTLKDLYNHDVIDISIQDYMKLDQTVKSRLVGLRCNHVDWPSKEINLVPYNFGYNATDLIPKNMIVNNSNIRLNLLAGIIDKYNVSKDQIEIRINLEYSKFVDDIVFLARSLGLYCKVTKNDIFNITIDGENVKDIPTLVKYKNTFTEFPYNTTGHITIKDVGNSDYVGITIDNNQRFLINDFTVTHNCANIFANRFIVEIDDAKRSKRFKQEWQDNMSIVNEPTITKLPVKTKSSVKITFYPDLKRFGIKELGDDYMALIHRRTVDIAGTANNKLNVYFNNTKVTSNNFKSYIELYYKDTEIYYDMNENNNWTVGVLYKPDAGGEVVSFVNSIATYRGGTHCAHVIDNVIKTLINDYIKKKDKDIKITPTLLKDNLVFFINSVIVNPAFSSQTKDTLTTKVDKFGSKYEPSPTFFKKLAKCGIVEQVIELAKFKENSSLKKTDGKKMIKILGIPKLDDANKAGTKESNKCTLILTEGDSAKATAMAGLGVVGRDFYGVFPLKGKMLNVREASPAQLLANEEIKNLKVILGLKQGEDYSNDDKFNTLRYGHVIVFTDQDYDGSHIKGLFINMLHTLWPSLLKRGDFVQSLNTPIVKAFKNKEVLTFYNLTDYEKWKETPEAQSFKIKYYKGLGTSTTVEAREYFVDINTKLINYFWENVDKEVKAKFSESDKEKKKGKKKKTDDDNISVKSNSEDESIFIKEEVRDDDDAIKLGFDKTYANARKDWLMKYDKNKIITYEQKNISYYDFIHSDLIHFSNEDLNRSIPSIIDGLKPSQRKTLFGAFLRGLDKTEVKVSQLGGFVSDKGAYHHGEASLYGTIVGMAQDFVGSNNINILKPNGQFGTRIRGGKDSASPRYIWTMLDELTTIIFNPNDDPVLNQQDEDGMVIEPEFYAPIIPMVLVNGAEGIGTGFSTKIPPYNPIDIITNLKRMIKGKSIKPMEPWWQGFQGNVKKMDDYNYEITGNWSIKGDKIIITELPVYVWTGSYKEDLEAMLAPPTPDKKGKKEKDDNPFIGYKDNNTDTRVHFELLFDENYLIDTEDKEIEKKFGLIKKYSITNMHLYSPEGHIKRYNTVADIMTDYYKVRLALYLKRKEHMLSILAHQLKIISYKVKFILQVIDKKIEINNKKKLEIEEKLVKLEFPKLNVSRNKDEGKASYDYLLSMPIYNLTNEKIEELKKQEQDKQAEYDDINSKTPEVMWGEELEILEAKYIKWVERKIEEATSTTSVKVKKTKK